MYWSARPFVRIFFFLSVGIFFYFNVDFFGGVSAFALLGSVLLLLVVAFLLLPKRLPYKWHWIKGVVLAPALVLTGMLVAQLQYPPQKFAGGSLNGSFLGIVNGQPSQTETAIKVKVRLVKRLDSINCPLPENVLLYFEKDTLSLKYGDEILFSSALRTPVGPANPEEFNYKAFLKYSGVAMVGFVSNGHFKVVGYKPPNRLLGFAIGLRQKLLEALRANGLSGDEYAVAAAIVLGYDDVMDDNIRQNYQRAGAMHVLCVSGLHVGVIYLVMLTLLRFLNKTKKTKIIRAVLLLLTVWSYALLTGLSPSVLRATVMVSFFIVGNEVERDKDAYNTLAMSAVFLLLFNPAFLFNVGFQLSYAAVVGIVTFYLPFYRLLYFKNVIINKLWAATAVSMAAQLGAFPVAAHYFHFFPVWFLLSNLIVMLFSTVIISTGMLFLVVSWIPVVSGGVALVLSGLIYLMNYLIELFGHLPFSGIDDLYFPWFVVTLVYFILFFAFRLFQKKETGFIIPLLSVVLVCVLFVVSRRYQILTQNSVVVYNVGKKHTAIDFISGKRHVLLCDSVLFKHPEKLGYVTENYRIKQGLDKKVVPLGKAGNIDNLNLWSNEDFIVFNGISMLLLNDTHLLPVSKPLHVDWILIRGNHKIDVEKLMHIFSFDKVIIEPPVYADNVKEMERKLKETGASVYNIGEQGAFVYNENFAK